MRDITEALLALIFSRVERSVVSPALWQPTQLVLKIALYVEVYSEVGVVLVPPVFVPVPVPDPVPDPEPEPADESSLPQAQSNPPESINTAAHVNCFLNLMFIEFSLLTKKKEHSARLS